MQLATSFKAANIMLICKLPTVIMLWQQTFSHKTANLVHIETKTDLEKHLADPAIFK